MDAPPVSLPSYIAGYRFRGSEAPEVAALYHSDRGAPIVRLLLIGAVLLMFSAFWSFVLVIGRMFGAW
jgi:hypothetical protein